MKKGWTYKKLGEVCEIFGRIGFRGYTKADLVNNPNEGAITLSPSNIVDGEMDYTKCSYITWVKYEESPEIKIYPGDILIVKTASVGKTALVKSLPHKATINPQFVVLKNLNIFNYYLSYYLKSEQSQKYIWSIAKGAAAQTVSQKNLAEMQIPVPPIEEQQNIVSRLDAAFAHIDELKANAEKQLNEARKIFQNALEKAMEPKEGWEEKPLKTITAKIGSGATPLGGRKVYISEGVSLVRSMNVHYNKFKYDDLAHINDEAAEQLNNVELRTNDVLFNITGASIARCCVLPNDILPARVNQHVSIIRPIIDIVSPNFLCLCLISANYQKQLLSIGEAGSTRQALTKADMEDFKISIPPLQEQQAIVSRLDALNAHVKELEEVLNKTITECDALKQALLRKVFE